MALPQIHHRAYTVGWVCARPESELVAAIRMLDQRHRSTYHENKDAENVYVYGEINGYNIVIGCLGPAQRISTKTLIQEMKRSFPNMKMYVLVGIGSGVPQDPIHENDVRLGDIVVGWAKHAGIPAILDWESAERSNRHEVSPLGTTELQNSQLTSAMYNIIAKREMKELRLHGNLERMLIMSQFKYPGSKKDLLFDKHFIHTSDSRVQSSPCEQCDDSGLIYRKPRSNHDPRLHLGTVLSGSPTIADAYKRDALSREYYNAICFDTEATGVSEDTHLVVIRGISDYADSHRNTLWQNYAAATAAVFAAELLWTLPPGQLNAMDRETFEDFKNPRQNPDSPGSLSLLSSSSLDTLQQDTTRGPYTNLTSLPVSPPASVDDRNAHVQDPSTNHSQESNSSHLPVERLQSRSPRIRSASPQNLRDPKTPQIRVTGSRKTSLQ